MASTLFRMPCKTEVPTVPGVRNPTAFFVRKIACLASVSDINRSNNIGSNYLHDIVFLLLAWKSMHIEEPIPPNWLPSFPLHWNHSQQGLDNFLLANFQGLCFKLTPFGLSTAFDTRDCGFLLEVISFFGFFTIVLSSLLPYLSGCSFSVSLGRPTSSLFHSLRHSLR